MKPVVAVVSLERTASQSVYQSLKPLRPAYDVFHAHWLDGSRWRPAPEPKKDAKDAAARALLLDKGRERIIFTIRRDPADRLTSALWYRDNALGARETICEKENAHPAVLAALRGAGCSICTLNFATLKTDFDAACLAAFGCTLPLLHVNSGAERGAPGGYDAFKTAARSAK